ncbi:MAG: hypothetical protein HKN47_10350 [Pirellulaceae bacterium]|nr:hypothetical protein [Pirellulaceae bacterium]
MKRSIPNYLVATLAMGFLLTATSFASAQRLGHNEFIVGQQVVSDEVAATPASSEGTFVGDLSANEAGVINEGTADSGSVDAGSFDSGMIAGGAQCRERAYGKPDLFYNFYTQGNCNRANAQMYVSPMPVPTNVGHTFNTYQPFYPHEYLYWHKNRFHNYYDEGRGMNRTRAVYYSPPARQAISNLYWNKIRLPR